MPWIALSDAESVGPGDRLRISLLPPTVLAFGLTEGKIRQYLTDYTMLMILSVNEGWFPGSRIYVEAIPTGTLTVGQVRESVNFALSMLRDEWLVWAPGLTVGEIEVKRGIDLSLPVTTTIGLVALAAIIMVGFVLWKEYGKDLIK